MNSEISYPKKFKSNRREVKITGEAFFEVVKQDHQPFLVYPGQDLVVEVLGTSFNVRAGEETGRVMVQVVTGKVCFYRKKRKKEKMTLTVGDGAAYSAENGFTRGDRLDENMLSWKTGKLVFKNSDLREVVSALSKYCSKTILIQGEGLDGLELTANYYRQPIMEIMEELKLVLLVDYQMGKDTIIIRPRTMEGP